MLKIISTAVLAFSVSSVVLLSGCQSQPTASGNPLLKYETSQSISSKVKKSRTTKANVIEILGQPGQKLQSGNGGEIWVYEYKEVTSGFTVDKMLKMAQAGSKVVDTASNASNASSFSSGLDQATSNSTLDNIETLTSSADENVIMKKTLAIIFNAKGVVTDYRFE